MSDSGVRGARRLRIAADVFSRRAGRRRAGRAAAAAAAGPQAHALAPTGNLDSRAGTEILAFMRTAVRDLGQTIVMVTHDPVAASFADRAVFLADGHIVDEIHEPTASAVLDRIKRLGG